MNFVNDFGLNPLGRCVCFYFMSCEASIVLDFSLYVRFTAICSLLGSLFRFAFCESLLQIVQFVRTATETGDPEARASIVDACDTLLNLLIKVPVFIA